MRFFWLVSAVVLTVLPAYADPSGEALSEFAKCSSISAVIERLQCYDNAAVAAKMALAAPPSAQQQASVQTGEEESGGVLQWFGLSDNKSAKKAEDFGRPPPRADEPKEVTEIAASVSKFGRTSLGRAIFTLDNGQVWTQIEGDMTEVRDAKTGDEVTVEKAFFGSYSLVFKERKGLIKVRRTK
ncbi:MAG: hypothetical protein HOP13_08345 [Alphaproteobacteria bacterium]|nr:hypothetical protein [Alphaproteobacteria bacterium]